MDDSKREEGVTHTEENCTVERSSLPSSDHKMDKKTAKDLTMLIEDAFSNHGGAPMSEVYSHLSSWITSSNRRHKNLPADRFNEVTITAHNLKSYLRLLSEDQLSKLLESVNQDTSQWLSNLLGIESGFTYFHDKSCNGLLSVCKLALYMKFAKYATDGFTALYTRPPVIYVSAAAPLNFGKDLRSQLGLPQSSICKVPCNTMFGSPYTMDVAAFERLLTDDVSCGKTPLILIAYAGTPVTGHTDNLSRLREICTQSGVWLHVEGDSLATLSLPKIPPSISAATSADSFTIDLPSWLGAVNIPHCTFYKTTNPVLAEQSGLVPKDILDRLTCLPLWALIKAVGIDDLKSVIVQASELAQQLSHRLDMVSGIKRLEQSNVISPTVIFKYKASPTLSYSSSNSLEDDEEEDSPAHGNRPALAPKASVDVSPKLCDAFNKALTERLQKSCGKVQIRLAQVSREGSCMSFNPLRGARANGTGNNDIDEFVEELEKEILKMDSTLISRTFFEDAFQSVPDVVLVDISDEPAVGAFQCIPKYWKVKDMSNLSDSKKKEANDLNRGLLQRLSEEFEYLAEGKTASGQVVIKIGLIDDSFDVNILAERVKELAEELEDNSKFLESLSDAIQKSIHQAEEVLQKESEEKFYEEGILRHVPVLGSVFSWLSPPAKESHGITGRAFTLASGKLESTEKTYRYKMQLENGEGSEEPSTETAAQPHDLTSPSEVEGHPVPPQEQQPVPEPITEPPSQTEAESSTLQAENATENEATAQEIEATPVEDKDKSITENAESTKSDVNSSKNSEVGEEVRESDV